MVHRPDEVAIMPMRMGKRLRERKTLEDVKRCVNLNSKSVAKLNEIEQFFEPTPALF